MKRKTILIFLTGFILGFTTQAQETLIVSGKPMGVSTRYMGVTSAPNATFAARFIDLGINNNRIFTDVTLFEPVDDDGTYGSPSIAALKTNFNSIPWNVWDNVLTGNGLKAYFQTMRTNQIKVIFNLRTPGAGWMPTILKTAEDDNEWWEHCAAAAYWLNVRNDFQVDDYQFFNEPDQGAGQGFGGGSKEDYVRMIRIAKDAIQFVYTTYLPTRKFETYGPVVSWPNDWIHDVLSKGGGTLSNLDYHHYASKNQFTDGINSAHGMMNETGYSGQPLWLTEWGSYDNDLPNVRQNDSKSFSIKMINNIINMCRPGDDHVNGWDYYNFASGTYGDELLDANGSPRTVYYALKMAISALKGALPVYQCTSGNTNLKAILSKDENGTINLLVTDTSSTQGFTIQADVSALSPVTGGTVKVYRYDTDNDDIESIGSVVPNNGIITFTIPKTGAILLKIPGTGSGKDLQAPSAPSNLVLVGSATYQSVSLTWTKATDNVKVDYYDIYANDKLINSTKGDAIAFTINKLIPSTIYTFYIKARDAEGNVSASNSVNTTTQAATIVQLTLPAPTNLTGDATSSSVKLLWSLSANDQVKGYKVYQENTLLATVNTSGYIINNLQPDTEYSFKISCTDNLSNESPFSVLKIHTELVGVTKLTGTIFGSSTSGGTNSYEKVFDGNTATFYDTEANGAYAGIDLGENQAKRITKVRFILDRGSWAAARLIGGKFQGSNTSRTAGYYDLFTIGQHNNGVWNKVPISITDGFRYLRYLAPDGSYGNINEVEFYGIDGVVSLNPPIPANLKVTETTKNTATLTWQSGGEIPVTGYKVYQGNNYVATTNTSTFTFTLTGLKAATNYIFKVSSVDASNRESTSISVEGLTKDSLISNSVKLTGIIFGTSPPYTAGNEYDKAFDGDVSTFFDYSLANGGYTGMDVGTAGKQITKIRFYPRGTDDYFLGRLVGGKFQGSNTSESNGYTDLYTVAVAPLAGWNEVIPTVKETFRYIRYLGPDGSYSDISEIEFYGQDKTVLGIEDLIFGGQLKIYPNPFEASFTLEIKDRKIKTEILATVYDMTGKVIAYGKFIEDRELYTTNIDLTNMPKGIYVVTLSGKNLRYSKKVIKF